ncbi:MAG: M28 family metallopeptidase, partial [Parvularcula sp.]|nr:M28 family metallopeptidase [Parvularcula sp.]
MTNAKALLGITVIALGACQSGPEGASNADLNLPPVSEDVITRHVATLASDAFEGRAPGTPGGLKTREYLVTEMRRLGLEPIGDSYELPVTMVSRETLPAQSAARFDYGGVADDLAYRSEAVFWSARDAQRISIRDSEVVFVGHGVVAPEYGWDDYAGLDVSGKTVVMLINDPGFRLEGDDFAGRAMTYYGRYTYKFEEAARQGAEAAIIVHQTAPAAYPWGVVEGGWTGPQLDLPRAEGAVQPVKVGGWITLEQARELFTAAGMNFEEMEERATRKGFEPVDMGNVTFSAELVQELAISESANVAGVLPGTERPDEYVLYTAHW